MSHVITGNGCLKLSALGSLSSKRFCAPLFLRTLHATACYYVFPHSKSTQMGPLFKRPDWKSIL